MPLERNATNAAVDTPRERTSLGLASSQKHSLILSRNADALLDLKRSSIVFEATI